MEAIHAEDFQLGLRSTFYGVIQLFVQKKDIVSPEKVMTLMMAKDTYFLTVLTCVVLLLPSGHSKGEEG